MQTSKEITQYYFDLSNKGDLDKIDKFIHPEATYSSTNTGLHFGKANIMQMMRGFFNDHSFLEWQIQSIEQLDDYITELSFQCNAIRNAGESYRFCGTERIVVADQLIRHIEVRT